MTPISFLEVGVLILFDFEKTEIGRLSRELNREIASILEELPQRAYESADNLQRATKSIGRNLAEGWGKWQIADKIRFFQTSRGSGTEAIASLNELVDFGYLPEARIQRARALITRLVAMIIGLIRYFENEPPRPKHGHPKRQLKDPPP